MRPIAILVQALRRSAHALSVAVLLALSVPATGEATLIGPIGSGLTIDGLAISPASPCLDIDGDGRADPLTDGIALLRMFFGLSGTAVTAGAVLATSPRNTWALLRTHLNANCGLRLPP